MAGASGLKLTSPTLLLVGARLSNLFERWRRLSLARQFLAASCCVSIFAVLAIGIWVTKKIEQSALETSSSSLALYIGHFVSPHLQELVGRQALSEKAVAALDEVMQSAAPRMGVSAVKVWRRDGTVLYSSNRADIGRVFPPDETQLLAWQGSVSAEYNQLHSEESKAEHASGIALFEVYVPIREDGTDRIIAVAEFYQVAHQLEKQLRHAKWQSWVIAGLVAVTMISALSSIVADGSRTIKSQREALAERVVELATLLRENQSLYDLVERNSQQAAENNDRFLREIGSDIHDGPAQLLALALLRLGELNGKGPRRPAETIRGPLAQALKELRDISAGLVLPEIAAQTLEGALGVIVRYHEGRTQTRVDVDFCGLPDVVSPRLKNYLCRFVQETLTNASRHAGGKGQRVRAWSDGTTISVQVSDQGPGMAQSISDGTRLGLICLKDRINSLGGTVSIESDSGSGTTVTATVVTTAV